MRDPYTQVEVTLVYGVLEEYDIITRCSRIQNAGEQTVFVNAAHSTCISFPTDQMDMITFYGSWGHERCAERASVRHGKITVDSARGISSHYQNPSAMPYFASMTSFAMPIKSSQLKSSKELREYSIPFSLQLT